MLFVKFVTLLESCSIASMLYTKINVMSRVREIIIYSFSVSIFRRSMITLFTCSTLQWTTLWLHDFVISPEHITAYLSPLSFGLQNIYKLCNAFEWYTVIFYFIPWNISLVTCVFLEYTLTFLAKLRAFNSMSGCVTC